MNTDLVFYIRTTAASDEAIIQSCDVFKKTACCAVNGSSCCNSTFQYNLGNLESVIDGDGTDRLRTGLGDQNKNSSTTATPTEIDMERTALLLSTLQTSATPGESAEQFSVPIL